MFFFFLSFYKETKLICVKALINLMADNELHKEMVKKDVIWGLSNLAQTDNVEILSLCSKSLCRLSVKFAKVFNYSF